MMCSLFGFALWILCFMGWVKKPLQTRVANVLKIVWKCFESNALVFVIAWKHHEKKTSRFTISEKRKNVLLGEACRLQCGNGGTTPRDHDNWGDSKLASCGECLWYPPPKRRKMVEVFWGGMLQKYVLTIMVQNAAGQKEKYVFFWGGISGKVWQKWEKLELQEKHWLVDLYLY